MVLGNNRKIPNKHGGKQHLKGPPSKLLLAQSESYVEHSHDAACSRKDLERAVVPPSTTC